MSECKYCKEPCLFDYHLGCQMSFNKGKKEIYNYLMNVFKEFGTFDAETVRTLCRKYYVNNQELNTIYVNAFTDAVNFYLYDNFIDNSEKRILNNYVQFTQLPRNVLNRYGAADRVLNGNILDCIIHRHIIPELNLNVKNMFLVSNDETPIFVFYNVNFYEEYITKGYVSKTFSASVKLFNGMYVTPGVIDSEEVITKSMEKTSTGRMCLTDKNLYFVSNKKSIKIPYSQILNIYPKANGIIIHKDSSDFKPVAFSGIDPWIAVNLIYNLR